MKPQAKDIEKLVADFGARRIDRGQFLRRGLGLGLSMSAVGSLLAACGGEEAPEGAPAPPPPAATGAEEPSATSGAEEPTAAPQGGTLRYRLLIDVINLDPANMPGSVEEEMMAGTYEQLVSYKPGTLDRVNSLAETFEPSSDGLSIHFKLKEGIPFHKDYGEVTAEDVKFSFERVAGLTKPKIDSPYKGDWAALKEVQVDSTYEGTIVLKEKFAPLLRTTLPVIYAGSIHSKKAVEELGDKYATNPVGTGPYEFAEWVPKQHVIVKRFADWGGASSELATPQWDEIQGIPVVEDSAADIALETGDVDFGQLPLASIDRFSDNSDFSVLKFTTFDYGWIGMNMLDETLQDVNVRQAVRYGIDIPSILEAAFEGRYARASAILPENLGIGYWADAPVYDRDVDKAKGYLAASGLSSLDLTMHIPTGEIGTKPLAEIVQANLGEIGINVKIVSEDPSSYYALTKDDLRSRQLFYVQYVGAPDPYWLTEWFTCDQFDIWNWMYWCDKQADALQAQAVKEFDDQRRGELYIEFQKLWDQAVHTVWSHYPVRYIGAKKGIEPAARPDGRLVPWATRSV
jgi:peptide/nickel transport system substrate-binding protein